MKKFYKQAAAVKSADHFTVQLDGRSLKTPSKSEFLLPTQALAEAVAREWQDQEDDVDLKGMMLTTFCYASIDRVRVHREEVIAEVTAYAETDLLCYPADNPETLVVQQKAAWQPLLDWAAKELGMKLSVASGIIVVVQSDDTLATARKHVADCDDFTLAAVDRLTHITGSLVLALAVLRGHLTVKEAYELGHLEDRWQAQSWGTDAEAEQRHEDRIIQAGAAGQLIQLVSVGANK
jgi:chaperone required for assembly of F1-ATPase